MELLIITSMPIGKDNKGNYLVSKKFISGINCYLEFWPGNITVISKTGDLCANFMDASAFHPDELPFKIKNHLNPCEYDLVLASLEASFATVASLCHTADTPIIYISEFTYETQKQIMYAETTSLILRYKKLWWLWRMNKQLRQAVEIADGIQCNGTPTYEVYRHMNRSPLLFFDSRMSESMLASREEISTKLNSNKPLRLAFSGRLIKIKGVDHLIELARILVERGMAFSLDICGEGALSSSLKEQIQLYQLNMISLKGNLDFKTVLVPYFKTSVDLFICPHVQGDPSCTYLETLSCGIPIIGYENEAFKGIVNYSKTGWLVPLNDPKALAEKILMLDKRRDLIQEASFAALEFAKQHTLEKTFKKRTDHFLEVVRNFHKDGLQTECLR